MGLNTQIARPHLRVSDSESAFPASLQVMKILLLQAHTLRTPGPAIHLLVPISLLSQVLSSFSQLDMTSISAVGHTRLKLFVETSTCPSASCPRAAFSFVSPSPGAGMEATGGGGEVHETSLVLINQGLGSWFRVNSE